MAMEANGNGQAQERQIPGFSIGWDGDAQDVILAINPTVFKNPGFVIAMLDMAKAKLEAEMKMMYVQNLKARDAEAKRTQAILEKLQR